MSTVYQNVAKKALINWNGLTDEDALNKISNESIDELESQVGAISSISNAIVGVSRVLGLSNEERDQFLGAAINGPEDDIIFETVCQKAKSLSEDEILDVLATIHNGWVLNNTSDKIYQKKVERGQLRQYAPLELIGWNEVESDLLFLEPVLSAIGVSINRDSLEKTYHERVSEYLDFRDVYSFEDLVDLVSQGSGYYPELPIELDYKLLLAKDILAAQIVQNWEEKDVISFQIFTDRDRESDIVK